MLPLLKSFFTPFRLELGTEEQMTSRSLAGDRTFEELDFIIFEEFFKNEALFG